MTVSKEAILAGHGIVRHDLNEEMKQGQAYPVLGTGRSKKTRISLRKLGTDGAKIRYTGIRLQED